MGTATQNDQAQAEALMCSDLRAGEPIAAEYPLVFEGGFPGQLVAVHEDLDGERHLRSACAILVRELVTPAARLRVGFIGSVVTDSKHRGQGWGRDVMAKAEETLRSQGCQFSLLWADDAAFYQRQGYVHVGTELNYLVDPCVSGILPSMQRVREACEDDFPALFKLYSEKPVRVERTVEEMAALLQAPGMELLVRESEGRVGAYSCVGRGPDFASVVHEWAGPGEDVLALLQGHLQRRAEIGDVDPLIMMVPCTDQGVRNFFELIEAPSMRGVLGMAKVLDQDSLLDTVGKLVGDQVAVTSAPEGGIAWAGPAGNATLAGPDLLTTLLEPKGARTAVAQLEQALGATLEQLPLRPFVWGLDSI